MKDIEDEYMYEDKMDQITDYLEDLILDAFIAVLKNLKHKNDLLASPITAHSEDKPDFWYRINHQKQTEQEYCKFKAGVPNCEINARS